MALGDAVNKTMSTTVRISVRYRCQHEMQTLTPGAAQGRTNKQLAKPIRDLKQNSTPKTHIKI